MPAFLGRQLDPGARIEVDQPTLGYRGVQRVPQRRKDPVLGSRADDLGPLPHVSRKVRRPSL